MPGRTRRGMRPIDYWPGFVDALSTLVLVVVFLLTVFMVAQFFLTREITGKDTALQQLNAQIAQLTDLLALERTGKRTLQDQLSSLQASLSTTEAERDRLKGQLAASSGAASKAGGEVALLQGKLTDQQRISNQALAQVELLNQQIAALRRQIAAIEDALEASEKANKESEARIADLGSRLNVALAKRVQELARYRSDFFGRLRQILAGRPDIRVVGDRFVFQSEVLFPSGVAMLSPEGLPTLDKLADAIVQLEKEIPPDINWVLQVNGHTDARPISSSQFPSNWELSAARAIAVVKYLISKGVDPQRLVAAGFGEFDPIDPGTTEDAYRKNRRIELKLTER
ncbi:MAG TPA: peptidoglycan -binding protein [Hyphomicrobiales bacterium]|nr:peptidoglycan -binding protein [Hyphomicrobiales bacterium]